MHPQAIATDDSDLSPTGTTVCLHDVSTPGEDRLPSPWLASPVNDISSIEVEPLTRSSSFTSPFKSPSGHADEQADELDAEEGALEIERAVTEEPATAQPATVPAGEAAGIALDGRCEIMMVKPADTKDGADLLSSGSAASAAAFPSSSSSSRSSSSSYPSFPSSLSFAVEPPTVELESESEPELPALRPQHSLLRRRPFSLSFTLDCSGPMEEAKAEPAAASSCSEPAAMEQDQQEEDAQQPQLRPAITNLHMMRPDSNMYRELRANGVKGFVKDYEGGGLLGQGANGCVYSGTVVTEYGAVRVAIKTPIQTDSDSDNDSDNDCDSDSDWDSANQLLRAEGEVMFQLQYKGLVDDGCTVRALGLTGKKKSHPVQLLMELAQCSLWDKLDEAQARPDFCRGQTTVLPMRDVFRVLRAVTSALAATHRLGFVHQDVKTDNVLCRDDGSYCLGDFGCVAKIPKNRKILADTYHKDDCCGSPDFCAPEAALANRDLRPKTPWLFLKNCIRMRTKLPLTRAVDIYSLGVLAVCLLVTGTFQESAARYAHRELPLPPHVPSALAQLVLDCTEDKSHQRPSAEQVLQRLDAMEAEVLAAEAKATAE
ncbi:hypothetical protein CHLRE_12g490200v5 [Chlamydomonas reinhardtii]|uniref:Uncharacterized protein n=1 Tax=Chlamydomonas reinhardtii TaxID=3055 RepID=A8ILM9_CHLRE|nr:uncharacterized protein CHLRE_12g490200v5 [Chlamydomonas reinhardtii]PNW74615.1 hypothetical protein CHLRE_12g490200v5 [Chlamydomonas reinhardtii]|eukprot:XP_001690935.1 predicted protein [Chlamydomonas reinhardtii]